MCFPKSEFKLTESGERCIDLLRAKRPDIVILDSVLKDIDGFETIKQIRSISDVPILMLSYSKEESQIVKAFDLGADDYMAKPIHQMEAVVRVKSLIKRKPEITEGKRE